MLMLALLLGWRKASKCKKLLKQVRSRLECLKNERSAISTQLRKELEKLDDEALNLRIEQEQHIRDESSVYNLLDHFCNLILKHSFYNYIRTHKQCRQRNLAEAVSSLVFASSRLRCGVIPELEEIRDLFGERYGESFVETTVKLVPGNRVNPTFKKSILALFPDSVVPNDRVKQELVKPSFTSSSTDEAPERSSTAEEKDDEDRNNKLQLITFQSSKHVHPKLPDWDDIFTKFRALKKPKYVNPKLPEYDDITAKDKAVKSPIINNENTTADNYRSQLEYDDEHDNIDDGAMFSYSWLSIESILAMINQPQCASVINTITPY
ncbi:uncharacterized protein LOC112194426 [Rosa chinensis]|uniref:uncharacterized protein LOC112194426 n=1 Tax=Rosa chinensis TaxID=74649 RepID=UPI000D08B7D8|nr:uncharacterized protein LOC112194426 [Rosa chinensis]